MYFFSFNNIIFFIRYNPETKFFLTYTHTYFGIIIQTILKEHFSRHDKSDQWGLQKTESIRDERILK